MKKFFCLDGNFFEKSIDKLIYLCYNIYTKKEKEINKMTVKLMVDWRAREILSAKELDERIDARVEEVMGNTEAYDEYLDDFIDSNYTKMELSEALTGGDEEKEEVLTDIRAGVADAIYDWVYMNISSDYSEVIVEV
jgi:hypothetical protein